MPSFRLHPVGTSAGGSSEAGFTFVPQRLIVAGYTGRDEAAVQAHIDELATIGVPRPASVPAFYELDPELLTTEAIVEVGGSDTSGEAEPVLVRHDGHWYLGVGSDHTDRNLERSDIARSKAACPKPLSERVLALPDELSTLDWDGIRLASTVDGVEYQRGTLAQMRTAADLVTRMAEVTGAGDGELVVFCGTLPLLTGEFRPGTQWEVSLQTPDETLTCAYDTKWRTK